MSTWTMRKKPYSTAACRAVVLNSCSGGDAAEGHLVHAKAATQKPPRDKHTPTHRVGRIHIRPLLHRLGHANNVVVHDPQHELVALGGVVGGSGGGARAPASPRPLAGQTTMAPSTGLCGPRS